MAKIESPFDVLGIKADATDAEVKTAYRELVKLHHPDKGGDDAKFRQIQAAYNKAKSPKWRKQYAAIAQVSQNNQRDDDLYSKILNSLGNNSATLNFTGRNAGKTAMYQQFANAYGVPASALQGNSTVFGASPSFTKIKLAQNTKVAIDPRTVRNLRATHWSRGHNPSPYNSAPVFEASFEYIVDDKRFVPIAGDVIANLYEIFMACGNDMLMGSHGVQARITNAETEFDPNYGYVTCRIRCEWS